MRTKKEKWKVVAGEGDPSRFVVDQHNVLIADCYANTSEAVGLPTVQEYKSNARRIAMLPDLLRFIEKVRAGTKGELQLEARFLLSKCDKLKVKNR